MGRRPQEGAVKPDLGFSYLFAHPEALGVSLSHPAALFALLLVPAFLVLARTDFRRARLALGARVMGFAFLVLALAGLALNARLPTDRLSLIAAVDVSQSIDAEGRK